MRIESEAARTTMTREEPRKTKEERRRNTMKMWPLGLLEEDRGLLPEMIAAQRGTSPEHVPKNASVIWHM